METLRDISAQLNYFVEKYNDFDTTDEERSEIELQLEGLSMSFEEKIQSLATLKQAYEDKAESFTKELQRLKDWQSKCLTKAEWIKQYISSAMRTAKRETLDTDFYKFSFRKAESVIVAPEANVPKELCKYTPESWTPDKTALKKAIQSGEQIEGVTIETNQHLQIK